MCNVISVAKFWILLSVSSWFCCNHSIYFVKYRKQVILALLVIGLITQYFCSICYIFLHLQMQISMICLFTRHFRNLPEKDKIYIQKIYSKNFFQTCGNVHSQGEIVIKADGQSNCFTASIKYKWSHCQ